jgi:hypothetical protein
MRTYYAGLSPAERRAKFVDGRNLERVRERDRERYRQHPEKFHARAAVLRAIRRGDLTKLPCERCGTTDNVPSAPGSRPRR